MRTVVFGIRTAKEILRDPLSVIFGAGFPIVLLAMLSMIQRSIPVPLFEPEQLAPGIAVFSLAFLCLFTASLVAKDRAGCLLMRLRTTRMTAANFILGYTVPMLPIAFLQLTVTYGVALILGLSWSPRILAAIAAAFPIAIFHISLGVLCGCCLQERQVGGLCGALLTNVSAWLSGAWFDVKLVGGAFESLAYSLPFVNAVDCGRNILDGKWETQALLIPCIYAAAALLAAVVVARKRLHA